MNSSLSAACYAAVPWLLLMLGQVFVMRADASAGKGLRRSMPAAAGCACALLLLEPLRGILSGALPFAAVCSAVLSAAVRPAGALLLCRLLCPAGNDRRLLLPAALGAGLQLTAFFTPLVFDPLSGTAGPLYAAGCLPGLILSLLPAAHGVRECLRRRDADSRLLLAIALLPFAGMAADALLNPRQAPLSCFSRSMAAAVTLDHLRLRLSHRRGQEAAEKERAAQRVQIMMSQIQPHFLYNTLAAIQALCRIDPEKASATVEKLGQYLRDNLDSLNRDALIPFEKEMEHTRLYADIETLRFPSVQLVCDLEDTDFQLPALTVQPLVENAIRHGLRMQKSGLVMVVSRREPGAHVLEIRDNGRGFDVAGAMAADESHIGLRNVRERLEQLCGADMTIRSAAGEGTTVTIRIPADGKPGKNREVP